MFFQKISDTQYVIRVKRGEYFVMVLKKFCQQEKIEGGFFYGLGAVDEAELAHYHVTTKKYSAKKLEEALEVTNITGSIGMFEEEPLIHVHGSFSDAKMRGFGGHIMDARVSGTLEIYLTVIPKLEKEMDEETGLKLFTFKDCLV